MEVESYPSGEIWNVQHLFTDQLGKSMFETIRNAPLVRFRIYIPDSSVSGYGQQHLGKPLPVLYLLSPFKEDEFFYFNHGLKEIADRMIAAKEIKPMMIVCVNGSNDYGGSFYGNTEAGGKYADLIGVKTGSVSMDSSMSLIDYVDAAFNTLEDRESRAIGGVEMGAYGALRIAIDYSENFSSVSAISGPLDFDGADGTGGFVPLFKQVIEELDTNYHDMDTSSIHPLQSIFFAAATSFSPDDTGITDDGIVIHTQDSTTYFQPASTIKFHLPFDSLGDVYPPIWNLWLQNNLPALLANKPGALDSSAIFIMAHTGAEFGQYQQTVDFHAHLAGLGIEHTFTEFNGYQSFPAKGHNYMYDMIPKILKFHSDNLVIPD
jgi:hypothetical protein